jgi:RNA polymerase sigma-70 factor, ECF subfamily
MTDADQFEAFVRAHQDMVFATAVRLLGNPAEAEDVAQTVFLKAFERFDTIAAGPSAAGWLKTVTRNACLNHLSRYRSRWQFFSELAPSGAAFEAGLASNSSPARDLEHADEREHLEEALRKLPDHQRVPLVLFHFEEASYEEIASTLGISIAKVKTDIHRGREVLRNLLVRLKPDTTSTALKPGMTGARHGTR